MNALNQFLSHLPQKARRAIDKIKTPFDIQNYLQDMPYKGVARDRSPLNVVLDQQCHCLDGGFLGALLLWKLGFKPLVLDLRTDPGVDDDHVLALYQYDGHWGAVAKTNYLFLGFREAVHRNLHELIMTYFVHYANIHGVVSLRAYTRPFDVSKFPLNDWSVNEENAVKIYKKFYSYKPIRLITKKMASRLNLLSERQYAAETMFTDLNESFGNRKE
jgi:hypothetical protein